MDAVSILKPPFYPDVGRDLNCERAIARQPRYVPEVDNEATLSIVI
jgi:hypothetical protein